MCTVPFHQSTLNHGYSFIHRNSFTSFFLLAKQLQTKTLVRTTAVVTLCFRFVVTFMRALRIPSQRFQGKLSPVCVSRISKLCYYRLACVIKSLFFQISRLRGGGINAEKGFYGIQFSQTMSVRNVTLITFFFLCEFIDDLHCSKLLWSNSTLRSWYSHYRSSCSFTLGKKKASICTATGFMALHCVMETWRYMNLNSLCFAVL